MGPPLFDAKSPAGPPKIKPILSFSESEIDLNEANSEFSASESSDGELMNTKEAQKMWEFDSLEGFGLVCDSVASDNEFDRLNNKLLVALKQFSTSNMVFCSKCKAMKSMTKRGKVKNTYQFACGGHTVSATQILGTLPDSFIIRTIPSEPRHVFNETLNWLGKDQLSPELQELSSKRNAVKRYSAHRSPMKPQTSSLLASRNAVNTMYVEMRELHERVSNTEKALNLQRDANSNLAEINAGLAEQLKLLKEENAILKRHLNEPSTNFKTQSKTIPSTSTTYASVSNLIKPMNKPMKFYTQMSSKVPSTPIEVISAVAPIMQSIPKAKEEFSPLKLVFFKGCHRKSIQTYKTMLPTIGFEPHWARHVVFLAEDLLQITTFECKVDTLVKAMTSISSDVKHLPEFDPFSGISYAEYGTLSNESASKCYLSVMKQCAMKLQTDCKRTPSLRRIAFYLAKLVETKCINFQPTPRATRVFCLGDYIVKKEPAATAMDIEAPTSPTAETNELIVESLAAEQVVVIEQTPESDSDAIMKETSFTANDQ